jgi:hypothetical protein
LLRDFEALFHRRPTRPLFELREPTEKRVAKSRRGERAYGAFVELNRKRDLYNGRPGKIGAVVFDGRHVRRVGRIVPPRSFASASDRIAAERFEMPILVAALLVIPVILIEERTSVSSGYR